MTVPTKDMPSGDWIDWHYTWPELGRYQLTQWALGNGTEGELDEAVLDCHFSVID